MSLRRCLPAALLGAALSALLAAPALAASVSLGGSPLNVTVGDQGQLQAFRLDRTNPADPPGIFYHPTRELGDAGFFLAFPSGGPGGVWGFNGSAGPALTNLYTSTGAGLGQDAVTGAGTATSPLTQVSRYAVGSQVKITQTTTYVNGAQEFRVHWDVQNTSGAALTYKAIAAADFFFEGDDAGTGIFTQGPPRFIGGTNVDSGSSGGFVEASPAWSHYQALNYPSVWTKIEGAAMTTDPVWDDTVLDHPDDNAGGVEWDNQTLADNATQAYDLVIRSAVPSALQLNPTNAGSRQGVPVSITATAVDSNGQPYAGKTLRYTIAGPNATTGSATLNAAGSAVITDPGANAGTDDVTVFVDFNGDGVREPVEPQATALATFVDAVPPTCTIKVSGTLPGGGASGKPLVISVSCGEGATVTVATTLTPPSRSSHAASAARKHKPKKIKLKTKTVTVVPGQASKLKLAIPKSVARKYAGKTLTATMTVTARDAAGNVKKTTVKRKVKLAKIRHHH